MTWTISKVQAPRDGDFGHSIGAHVVKFTGPDGKGITDLGKTLAVWRKQRDGAWKCIAATWNSDLPAGG